MEANLSIPSRAVSYAERVKAAGGTYKEAAEKLGISTRTLRRYRSGDTNMSSQVKDRLNRGGKLTQLESHLEDSFGDVPPAADAHTDDLMERPLTAGQFATDLGAGELFEMEEIDEAIDVKVTARKARFEDGQTEWQIGGVSDDATDVIEEREKTFTVSSHEDQRHLSARVAPWLAEEGIVDSPDAAQDVSGIRRVV